VVPERDLRLGALAVGVQNGMNVLNEFMPGILRKIRGRQLNAVGFTAAKINGAVSDGLSP
jgi:hypothetical protein